VVGCLALLLPHEPGPDSRASGGGLGGAVVWFLFVACFTEALLTFDLLLNYLRWFYIETFFAILLVIAIF